MEFSSSIRLTAHAEFSVLWSSPGPDLAMSIAILGNTELGEMSAGNLSEIPHLAGTFRGIAAIGHEVTVSAIAETPWRLTLTPSRPIQPSKTRMSGGWRWVTAREGLALPKE